MPHDPIPDTPSTSLYRCEKCGDVVRAEVGQTALGHIHNDADGNYLGKDAEGRFVEFPDDGRQLVGVDRTSPHNVPPEVQRDR